jgi:EAL domain-containing protein (putative c-di-GMP-specific phosphodiesterase class I)
VLAQTGLPAGALTLEVNERILLEDADLVVDRLAELRGIGVKLAIDDFGTGYASLAYLRQLPADIIKIDPSFTDGLGRDETLALLTRTVVQVGHDLGMQVVAEGIEQPRQLAALREMGCGYGQGFLVARPMAAPGVEALIRTAATVGAAVGSEVAAAVGTGDRAGGTAGGESPVSGGSSINGEPPVNGGPPITGPSAVSACETTSAIG